MKNATRTTAQRTASRYRFRRRLVVTTWQSSTRTERHVVTKWVEFQSPELLLKAIAAVAKLHPMNITFSAIGSGGLRPTLLIGFGCATPEDLVNGVVTLGNLALREEDVKTMALYFVRSYGFSGMLTSGDLSPKPDSDDDGGEELAVPTVSQSMLAQMQAIAGVM